jgi:hypothetical protein
MLTSPDMEAGRGNRIARGAQGVLDAEWSNVAIFNDCQYRRSTTSRKIRHAL